MSQVWLLEAALTRNCRLNLMAVVPEDVPEAFTDSAARPLTACPVGVGEVPAISDEPLSSVCARLYRTHIDA